MSPRKVIDIDAAAAAYASGTSLAGVARMWDCATVTMRAAFRRHGVEIRPRSSPADRRVPIDIERAKELYASGMTLARVAAALGVVVATLHSRLVDSGWVARPPGSALRLSAERQDEIERMLMLGKTYAQIRAETGMTCNVVARVIHERGIERQNRGPSEAPMGRVWLYGPGDVPVQRWCARCSHYKPVVAFARHRRRKHGLNTTCRQCVGERPSIQQESVSPR